MTQGYPPSSQGQGQSYGYGYSSLPPAAPGYGEAPPASADRGLSDDYYGTPPQQQQANYSQQGAYGQQSEYGRQQSYNYSYPPSNQYGSAASPYNKNQQYPYDSPPPSQSPCPTSSAPYEPSAPYDPHQQTSPPPGAPHYGEPFVSSAPPPIPPPTGSSAPVDPNDPEQRGLMGALAGAAAGGYAGHKMHHGILGTLGGAYAGHKLEDAYKKHHQKPSASPQPAAPPVPPNHPNQGVQMLGNFSASSRNITVDKDFDLIAEVACIDGKHRLSSLSLNSCLTNDNGNFRWARGGNFGASAREVHLAENGRELRAELRTVDGKWQRNSIRLDERIENSDGDLKVVW